MPDVHVVHESATGPVNVHTLVRHSPCHSPTRTPRTIRVCTSRPSSDGIVPLAPNSSTPPRRPSPASTQHCTPSAIAAATHFVLSAFEQAAFPVLIHCKAGADRTGFAAALFLHYHEGWDIAEAARDQLTPAFGHDKNSRAGILDFFFATFAAQSGDQTFDQWWRGYDPASVREAFDRKL